MASSNRSNMGNRSHRSNTVSPAEVRPNLVNVETAPARSEALSVYINILYFVAGVGLCFSVYNFLSPYLFNSVFTARLATHTTAERRFCAEEPTRERNSATTRHTLAKWRLVRPDNAPWPRHARCKDLTCCGQVETLLEPLTRFDA